MSNERLVVSIDGGWQVGDLLAPVESSVYLTEIDTSAFIAGDPVYIDSAGDLQPASCNDISTADVVGIVGSTENTVILSGQVDGFVGLTPGSRYFLGDEVVTTDIPSTQNFVVVKMGVALTATKLLLDIDEVCVL